MKGKLSTEQLRNIVFKHLKCRREEVLVRAGIGEDCAVVDFGEDVLVMSTDPITAATSEVGKLAVNVNLNDLASNGCAPLGIMLTILAPENTPLNDIEAVVSQAAIEAQKYNVEIIGGHTEYTDAVNRIVVSVVAIGKQHKCDMINNKDICVGDVILMTKTAGLEGAGILAFDHECELKKNISSFLIDDAKDNLRFTSVVKEGLIASKHNVHAMHDVTEGGLLGGIWELCKGANLGCIIDESSIPIQSATAHICDYFEIDPLRLISSGAMLIVLPPEQVVALTIALDKAGIPVQEIGEIIEDDVCLICSEEEYFEIPEPKGDALYDIQK